MVMNGLANETSSRSSSYNDSRQVVDTPVPLSRCSIIGIGTDADGKVLCHNSHGSQKVTGILTYKHNRLRKGDKHQVYIWKKNSMLNLHVLRMG